VSFYSIDKHDILIMYETSLNTRMIGAMVL